MFLPGLDAPRGSAGTTPAAHGMIDPYGRTISYLRLSVTDRCDCRCVYCMPERMNFLPKRDVLSLEELDRVCSAFVKLGARKIRLTGGEPLVRRDVMVLIRSLSRHLASGALDELTLTTNGSQLARYAERPCRLRREADQRLARHAERRDVSCDLAPRRSLRKCWPVWTPRTGPDSRSRSTPLRSRASMKPMRQPWSNGRTPATMT